MAHKKTGTTLTAKPRKKPTKQAALSVAKKQPRSRSKVALSLGALVIITGAIVLLTAYLVSAQGVYTRKAEYYLTGAAIRDVPYCNTGMKLDIMQPRVQKYERSPYVIFLHGGGWKINTKSSEPNHVAKLDPLRDEGFAVVSIDYRLITEGYYYPAPVEDTFCAIRFLKANADLYKLDRDNVGLYGFSAGGYLAGMAATVGADDQTYDVGQYKEHNHRVKAVVILAGLIDFSQALYERNYRNNSEFLQGRDIGTSYPAANISADDPPTMLIHGRQDLNVPWEQSQAYHDKLKSVGVPTSLIIVDNAEHSLGDVELPASPSRAQTAIDMRTFYKHYMGTK